MGYDRLYFLKKSYALYPGVFRPIAASALEAHYRGRKADRRVVRTLIDMVAGIAFLLWVPWRARQVQRKFGLDAAWRRRAISIARTRFADPNDIALFRIEHPDALASYIRRFEDAALNKRINPRVWTPACVLADKSRFAERCVAALLPHAETLAKVVDGRIEVLADPAGRALVSKPADGEGGDGVRMLGRVASRVDLARRLAGLYSTSPGTIVIQPRIEVHPALADLALEALPTARIVTMLNERAWPEVVGATFRFASDAAARVDNMKAGGLIAPVDLPSGTLGRACKGYGGGDHDVHPVTGGVIAGRTLPNWHAAAALVVRAHADAFADYALIGWDVALTPNGPLLIEGNGKPSVLLLQRAARRGLGEGRYGALLAHNLAIKR